MAADHARIDGTHPARSYSVRKHEGREMSLQNRFERLATPAVYVIHENDAWVEPLRVAFRQRAIPFTEWFVDGGTIDLDDAPPQGVFYNRMSASSHTRAHRYAVELTAPLLAWLQAHGRRVVNGRRALQLEVSKVEQYLALRAVGVPTPRTLAANGRAEILAAARALGATPFIVKPNRGGKGLGVRLYQTLEELERAPSADTASLDGIELVQQYIRPAHNRISRMEFIGGRFYYQVDVDTSDGFELCPADQCEIGDRFCPTGDTAAQASAEAAPRPKFSLAAGEPDAQLVARLERFFRENDAEIAAAEYVENAQGERFVYDINMNTNYNRQAELEAGGAHLAMDRVAEFLGQELARLPAV